MSKFSFSQFLNVILVGTILTTGLLGCEDLDQLEVDRENSFIKLYGGIVPQQGNDLIQTSDGGFLLLGSSLSAGNRNLYDLYIVKTDPEGNEEWSRFIDADDDLDQGDDFGMSITPTQDGAYLLAGYTTRSDNTQDPFLVKIRENNQVEWKRIINKPSTNEQIFDVLEASNNDIILVGKTSQRQSVATDPALDISNLLWFRLNSTGEVKLDSSIRGFAGFDEGRAMIKRGENFVIVGTTAKPPQQNGAPTPGKKVWVVEFGSRGGIINAQEFPKDNSFEAEGVDILQGESGEVVILGNALGPGIESSWVFQLSSDLASISKSYLLDIPGDSRSAGIKQNSNGDWVISGTLNQGGERLFVHVLSVQEELVTPIWPAPQSFGFPGGSVRGSQVIPIGEEHYGMVGSSSFGNNDTLMVFIKTLSDGTLK